jgi:hypothetical protein
MSSFHNPTAGILSAATTFASTTTGIYFLPNITDSLFFQVIAITSYVLLSIVLISFIVKQVAIKKHLKSRR